jgi:ribonuclease P protein component
MLKKKERISRKKFNELFKNSKIISRGSFFMLRKHPDDVFTAAVVVPKKIAKKATERNHIKRLTYSLIAEKIKQQSGVVGSYIFIFQKKPIQIKDIQGDFEKITFV